MSAGRGEPGGLAAPGGRGEAGRRGGRGAILIVLWASGLAVAGGAGTALTREAAPVTHAVTIDATRYQPVTLTVRAGDTVVWTNKDLFPHTVTGQGGAFDSDVLVAGASWRLTLKKKGAVDYACIFHPTMTGRLEVR